MIITSSNYTKQLIPAEVSDVLSSYFSSEKYMEVKTSGSTSAPKIIKIAKAHLQNSAHRTLKYFDLKEGDKVLMGMSVQKIGGLMMLIRAVEGQLDIDFKEPSANILSEDDGEYSFVPMVPYQAYHSINELHKAKKVLIGGAAISLDLEEKLLECTPEFYHSYGMTETISHIAIRKLGSSSNYKALDGVQLSVDQDNCLIIDVPDIGVHKLNTNDIVELISPSEFKFLGRKDFVVNSGGIKLFPEQIERTLGDLGFNYFLSGEEDAEFGQRLVMIVEGSEREIPVSTFNRLDRYSKPKKIYFKDEFIRSDSGKVLRKY